jgi:hypothetical protein
MSEYDDDRRGMMRVHVAHERASRACDRYKRDGLRAFAKGHGVRTGFAHKRDLAWYMAQAGLIDHLGYLRDGFPGGTR